MKKAKEHFSGKDGIAVCKRTIRGEIYDIAIMIESPSSYHQAMSLDEMYKEWSDFTCKHCIKIYYNEIHES